MARTSTKTSTALVVIDDGLKAAVGKFYPRLTNYTSRASINGSGYGAGKVAGSGVALSRPAAIGGARERIR